MNERFRTRWSSESFSSNFDWSIKPLGWQPEEFEVFYQGKTVGFFYLKPPTHAGWREVEVNAGEESFMLQLAKYVHWRLQLAGLNLNNRRMEWEWKWVAKNHHMMMPTATITLRMKKENAGVPIAELLSMSVKELDSTSSTKSTESGLDAPNAGGGPSDDA
jgi:hypothetical protein